MYRLLGEERKVRLLNMSWEATLAGGDGTECKQTRSFASEGCRLVILADLENSWLQKIRKKLTENIRLRRNGE